MIEHQNRRHNVVVVLLAALALVLPGATTQAQTAQPQASNGEDYAANELGNPWDMTDPTAIAYEYSRDNGDIANFRFEDGKLKGTTKNDARVSLITPSNPNVNPVPPEGGFRPINTAKYRYMTVRINVDRAANATVYWQAGLGTEFIGYAESGLGFKQLNPGDNIITFDLGAAPKWTGAIQGLYFDPDTKAGTNFAIDYVRLSTVVPQSPNNNIPRLNITAPSFISGPDYATTELGNPWDMNDVSDVKTLTNIKDVSFDNGILRGTNTNGDPSVSLRLNGSINTAKYKYVTYRMSLDGTIDTNLGSVARVIWWSDIPERSTVSRDIVIYEGYRTVSFDLNTIRNETGSGAGIPWSQSAPIVFRLDPHEFTTPRPFNLDYVMLTGDSTANSAYDIRYTLNDADGGTPSTQFFYDTDRNPGGGTPISCGAAQSQAAAGNRAYLPLVVGPGAPPVVPNGASCRWNTANVPNGSYYIYGVANDGSDTVTRYSETPVVVSH